MSTVTLKRNTATTITLINSINCQEWDSFTASHKNSLLAQSLNWYSAFQNAYGHQPLYFIAKQNDEITGILPSYLIQVPLTGKVITSMPFLDMGGPCADSPKIQQELIQELEQKAFNLDVNYIEFRSLMQLPIPTKPTLEKVTLTMPLDNDLENFWKRLNAKVRNQVRKAQKSGLIVKSADKSKLKDFYKIWAINMRDLGSPVHSFQFFEEIFKTFGQDAHLDLVYKNSLPIGGLIGITHNDTFSVPWASSLREHFKLCPNMLLYWETIKKACELGCTTFDFGRSGRDQGTYHFKRQWGAEERQLYWYTIPAKNKSVNKMSGNSSGGKLLTSIWKHLPLQMTMWLGPKIRQYLTQ